MFILRTFLHFQGQCRVLRKINQTKIKFHEKRLRKSRAEDLGNILLPFNIQTSEPKSRNNLAGLAMKITRNQSAPNGSCSAKPVATAGTSAHKCFSVRTFGKQNQVDSFDSRIYHKQKRETVGSLEELEDTLMLKVAQLTRGDIYVSLFYYFNLSCFAGKYLCLAKPNCIKTLFINLQRLFYTICTLLHTNINYTRDVFSLNSHCLVR